MKPREYTITLTVRSDAPIAVLRDKERYAVYNTAVNILSVTVREIEPWDLPQQLELGGGG